MRPVTLYGEDVDPDVLVRWLMAYGKCTREIAEDCVQGAILHMLETGGETLPDRGVVRSLYRYALNLRMRHRTHAKWIDVNLDWLPEEKLAHTSEDTHEARITLVWHVLGHLPIHTTQLLIRHYMLGETMRAMAKDMGIHYSSVNGRLVRARGAFTRKARELGYGDIDLRIAERDENYTARTDFLRHEGVHGDMFLSLLLCSTLLWIYLFV